MPRPYQPSLLRLLHALTALAVFAAWSSGVEVYSRYDGRWGRLPWQWPGEWIDIHGTVGVLLLPVAVLFALYAIGPGRSRLRQPANAAALAALALALGSGKLMQEDWLREGQLHHTVYSLHLCGWLLITAMVIWHVLSLLQRGGLPLAQSMFEPGWRTQDGPGQWPKQIRMALQRRRAKSGSRGT